MCQVQACKKQFAEGDLKGSALPADRKNKKHVKMKIVKKLVNFEGFPGKMDSAIEISVLFTYSTMEQN